MHKYSLRKKKKKKILHLPESLKKKNMIHILVSSAIFVKATYPLHWSVGLSPFSDDISKSD